MQRMELSQYRDALDKSMMNRLRLLRQQTELREDLDRRMKVRITDAVHQLEILSGELYRLSPLQRIAGGYAYLRDGNGRGVRSVENVAPGDLLRITLRDGEIESRAETVIKSRIEGDCEQELRN
jgi:exodeoxyribonuclease VII large subunit